MSDIIGKSSPALGIVTRGRAPGILSTMSIEHSSVMVSNSPTSIRAGTLTEERRAVMLQSLKTPPFIRGKIKYDKLNS